MMRFTALLMFCGLVTGGLGRPAIAEQPPGDPEGGRRDPAATRPAVDGPRRGIVSTMPADGRLLPGDRSKGDPWRNRPEGGGRRGPDVPWSGPMFEPGRPGRHHGGPEEPALTPQEREELLVFVKERFPEVHKRLQRSERDDPAAYDRSLRRLAGPILRMMRLTKSDPQLADALIAEHSVEMELANLQAACDAKRPDADREKTRAKIRDLVAKRFDLRQQRLRMEIQGMRKRLDEATARLSQQTANRSQLIETEAHRMIDRMDSGPHAQPKRVPGGDAAHASPEEPPSGAGQR